MKWFSGGVAAAIASCRQENALFIVYTHGKDLENLKVSLYYYCIVIFSIILCADDSSDSKTTDEAWSSQEVLVCRRNTFIMLMASPLFLLKVSDVMSCRKYIALKVAKGSLEYIQFSQLCILTNTVAPLR